MDIYQQAIDDEKTILRMNVSPTSISSVIEKIKTWCANDSGWYVCVSNVHMCMETYDSDSFRAVVNGSDYGALV